MPSARGLRRAAGKTLSFRSRGGSAGCDRLHHGHQGASHVAHCFRKNGPVAVGGSGRSRGKRSGGSLIRRGKRSDAAERLTEGRFPK